MSEENLPNGTHLGSINIAGIDIHCHQLDDGQRILDRDGVDKLIDWLADGGELTEDDALKVASLSGTKVMTKVAS